MLLIDTKATLRTVSLHHFGRGCLLTVAPDSCLQGMITNSVAEPLLGFGTFHVTANAGPYFKRCWYVKKFCSFNTQTTRQTLQVKTTRYRATVCMQ